MELISNNDVYQTDKRNSRKMLLPTDAICVDCGIIFNAFYEGKCVICEDDKHNDPIQGMGIKKEDIIGENIVKIIKEELRCKDNICDHKEFIFGKQSIDLRILLDYHMEDLRAICEIHGCSEGSRGKMVICIMTKLHPSLDKRIDEELIRKMIARNKKRFKFWRDIESAIHRAKKAKTIKLITADECIDITEIGKDKRS